MKTKVVAITEKSCKELYKHVLEDFVEAQLPNRDLSDLATSLPTFNNVRSTLQRRRATVRPNLPTSLLDQKLEGEWTLTSLWGFCVLGHLIFRAFGL